jgi:hypothetical protein
MDGNITPSQFMFLRKEEKKGETEDAPALAGQSDYGDDYQEKGCLVGAVW